MDIKEIKTILLEGDCEEKIEILSYLCDVFESYNQDMNGFEEIMDFLIQLALESQDGMIKEEILESICKAVIYQNIDNVNFDDIEHALTQISVKYLPRLIDILSFTHNKKYIDSILQFAGHENEYVSMAVKDAVVEMQIASM